MGAPAHRRATLDDLNAVPAHQVAELIHGTLHVQPRPRSRHARSASRLGDVLGGPFDRGFDRPGGWIILDEPELHLGSAPDVLVPDLAGWRRERMPELPDVPNFVLSPDWVCKVLPPSTADVDRAEKVPIYGRERVSHVWLVDPLLRTLEVLRLDGGTYRIVTAVRGEARVRAEPFEALELELGLLWAT